MAKKRSSVTSKDHVTKPVETRAQQGSESSERFEVNECDDDSSSRPAHVRFFDLAGIVKPLPSHAGKDLEEIVQEIQAQRADDLVRRLYEE